MCVCVCVCVCVALVIQHAKRMDVLYCHLRPIRLYKIFPLYLITARFSKKPF